MSTGKVSTLYTDKTQEEALFPRTKVKAISDDNGRGLDAILSELASEEYVKTAIARATLGDESIDLSEYATDIEVANEFNRLVGTTPVPEQIAAAIPFYVSENGVSASIYELDADTLNGKKASDFAPSGYGLGGAVSLGNINTSKSGFYTFNSSTYNKPEDFSTGDLVISNNLQLGHNNYNLMLRDYSSSANKWRYLNPQFVYDKEYYTLDNFNDQPVYKKLTSDGVMMWSTDKVNWHTYADMCGASPIGYGIGKEAGRTIASCDDAIENGWYSVPAAASGNPLKTDAWLQCQSYDENNKSQTISNGEGHSCVRVKNASGWQDWCWIDPPMLLGQEYRTTEKWNGHPVYKKIVSTQLKNSTNGYEIYDISAESSIKILSWNGYITTDDVDIITLPFNNNNYNVWGYANKNKLVIFTNKSITNYKAYFEVRYIK